jgi:hypothetical protein
MPQVESHRDREDEGRSARRSAAAAGSATAHAAIAASSKSGCLARRDARDLAARIDLRLELHVAQPCGGLTFRTGGYAGSGRGESCKEREYHAGGWGVSRGGEEDERIVGLEELLVK